MHRGTHRPSHLHRVLRLAGEQSWEPSRKRYPGARIQRARRGSHRIARRVPRAVQVRFRRHEFGRQLDSGRGLHHDLVRLHGRQPRGRPDGRHLRRVRRDGNRRLRVRLHRHAGHGCRSRRRGNPLRDDDLQADYVHQPRSGHQAVARQAAHRVRVGCGSVRRHQWRARRLAQDRVELPGCRLYANRRKRDRAEQDMVSATTDRRTRQTRQHASDGRRRVLGAAYLLI